MKRDDRNLLYVLLVALFGCGAFAAKTGTAEPAAVAPAAENKEAPASSDRTATEAEIEAVQADVRKIHDSLWGGEFRTVIRYTNPKIVAAMGGPTKAESEIKKVMQKMQSEGLKSESFTFPRPPTFFSTETTDFVIVPTLMVVSTNGQRVESSNFQWGAKPRKSSTWTYIEGSQVKSLDLPTLFPDFPANRKFPETYRKKL